MFVVNDPIKANVSDTNTHKKKSKEVSLFCSKATLHDISQKTIAISKLSVALIYRELFKQRAVNVILTIQQRK